MPPVIYTAYGHYFDFANIESQYIDFDAIGHSLSQTNRFVGRTPTPYSVAQHSLLVAHLCVTPRGKFHALLHDASESFMGDVPGPLKKILPDYREIEAKVMKRIFAFAMFDPRSSEKEVNEFDTIALCIEVAALLPLEMGGEHWKFKPSHVKYAKSFIKEGGFYAAIGSYRSARKRWIAEFTALAKDKETW